MTRILEQVPEAIEPLFQCDIDESLCLYEGEARLFVGEQSLSGPCELRFAWTPHSAVEFRITGSLPGASGTAFLEVANLGLRSEVLVRRSQSGTEPLTEGMIDGPVEFGEPSSVSKVVFHVANFRAVFGEPIRREHAGIRGRIRLESGPWTVTIDPVAARQSVGPQSIFQRLEVRGGSAVTHVGVIARVDDAQFDARDAKEVLDDVGRTLSFAAASWCFPILRIGLDGDGRRRWQSWTAFRTEPWRQSQNWFSAQAPKILQSVFAGWRRPSPKETRLPLTAALGLYVDAHVPGMVTESRLVLLQAALEGLAEHWPFEPPDGWVRPPARGAAGRFLRVAASLGLPLSVPSPLKNLAALPHPSESASALEKMVWVRNAIAHLGDIAVLQPHPSLVRFEAKQIAALHVELAILRALGADGEYLNRTTATHAYEAERLPWLSLTLAESGG